MRLRQFITERNVSKVDWVSEADWARIRLDCKPYIKALKAVRSYDHMLYRDMRERGDKPVRVKVRQDRRPKDTPLELHNQIDKFFKKKFGVEPRGKGVFCWQARYSSVGQNSHLVFPIGNFACVYDRSVDDLYIDMKGYHFSANFIDDEEKFWTKLGMKKTSDPWPYITGRLIGGIESVRVESFRQDLPSHADVLLAVKPYWDKWVEGVLKTHLGDYTMLKNSIPTVSGEYEVMVMCKEYYAINIDLQSDYSIVYNEVTK